MFRVCPRPKVKVKSKIMYFLVNAVPCSNFKLAVCRCFV